MPINSATNGGVFFTIRMITVIGTRNNQKFMVNFSQIAANNSPVSGSTL